MEHGGRHTPADYAAAPCDAMRRLARRLPRGVEPAGLLHRAFDAKSVGARGRCGCVLTDYDDCVVVLDERDWNVDQWPGAVNRCTGRVIVVRPVEDLAQVPTRCLCYLPLDNLQSFPKHP